jgi:16S rRNA processing protein RimM
MDDLVLIARVRKVHGLKGELELETFTWDESRFLRLSSVLVRKPGNSAVSMEIASVRETFKGMLVRLKGIEDRTAAEEMRGAEFLIPADQRAPAPKGSAYYDEIIGMTVIDDETGEALGTVKNVLDMPASDVFVLDLNGVERLVANRSEEVKSVDTKKKELRVKLLEEY